MTAPAVRRWVAVRLGSIDGSTPPRRVHLVDIPSPLLSMTPLDALCGFGFAPADTERPSAAYVRCEKCERLEAGS